MEIKIENLWFYGRVSHRYWGTLSTHTNPIYTSFSFSQVYLIKDPMNGDAWPLAYALCRSKNYHTDDFKLYYDNKLITMDDLRNMTYYLVEDDYSNCDKFLHRKVAEKLKIELKKSCKFTLDEIIDMFHLEVWFLNKEVSKIMRIPYALLLSFVIGFVRGKKIICCPWLSYKQLIELDPLIDFLSKIAQKKDLLFLIPVENIDWVAEEDRSLYTVYHAREEVIDGILSTIFEE